MKKELLECRNLSYVKHGQTILKKLNFELYEGEVLGILGLQSDWCEILAKILSGRLAPQRGSLRLTYSENSPDSYSRAIQNGIWYIHRESTLVPDQSVASNILGLPEQHWLSQKKEARRVRFSNFGAYIHPDRMNVIVGEYLRKWDIHLDVSRPAGELSDADQLKVELARAIIGGARILVMDRISSFCHREDHFLRDVMYWLKGEGVSVIYMDNQLHPMMELADRILVIKEETKEGIFYPEEIGEDGFYQLLTNHAYKKQAIKAVYNQGAALAELSWNTLPRDLQLSAILHEGEILGFCDGNGQYINRMLPWQNK